MRALDTRVEEVGEGDKGEAVVMEEGDEMKDGIEVGRAKGLKEAEVMEGIIEKGVVRLLIAAGIDDCDQQHEPCKDRLKSKRHR